jgi:hypothetical protein
MSFGVSSESMWWRAAGLLAALSNVSCAGTTGTAKDNPFYQEGFEDGCATASTQGRPGQMKEIRNTGLYDKDADYRSGFTSGLASCRMGPPRL